MEQIYGRATGSDLLARALSSLEQLPEEAQTRLVGQGQDLIDAGQPMSTVAARLEQWIQQEGGGAATTPETAAAETVARPAEATPAAARPETPSTTPVPAAQPPPSYGPAPLPGEGGVATAERAAPEATAAGGRPPTAPAGRGGGARPPRLRTGAPRGGGGAPAGGAAPGAAARPRSLINRPPAPPGGGAAATAARGGGAAGAAAAAARPPRPTVPSSVRVSGGNIFSQLGQRIASATSPLTNIAAPARAPIEAFAARVGPQSRAVALEAHQIAQAYNLGPVGETLVQRGLAQDATNRLINDLSAQGLAVPAQSRNVPLGFQTASDNPASLLGQTAFHPDVAGIIRNIAGRSDIAGNDLGSFLNRAYGTSKQTIFNLSNFHTLAEALNAAASGPKTLANYGRAFLSDNFAQGVRNGMGGDFMLQPANAGVTGLNAGSGSSADITAQLGRTLRGRLTAGAVGGVGGGASGYV